MGPLKDYSEDFEAEYLQSIEKKVRIHNSEKGIMDDDMSAKEYKQMLNEVQINFRDCNKEAFGKDEDVKIDVSIKNVPELIINIFEFNTETYYKKTLEPFDTSIDVHGMVPAIQKTETEMFKDIPKNKITKHSFTFEELKGKVGLFIIELQGNGKVSRAIIKKGSLNLIHRSTSAGHVAFIIDNEREICKSDKTGIWINEKFYKAD